MTELEVNTILAKELNGENDWFQISGRKDLNTDQLRLFRKHLTWWRVLINIKDIDNTLLDQIITEELFYDEHNSDWDSISKYHAKEKWFIKKYAKLLDIQLVATKNQFKPTELIELFGKPEIGTGATIVYGSDSYPYTVIEVSKSGTRIKIQQDNQKPAEGFDYYGNQVYVYETNKEGSIEELSLRKNGYWKIIHSNKIVYIGNRRYYQDPSF